MRIYVLTEHYPNTYKPYLDAQFFELQRQGHELRIFAFGRFDAAVDPRLGASGLRERTRYVPETLRQVPRFGVDVVGGVVERPMRRARAIWSATDVRGPKRSLLDAARLALLPVEAPELCLIHNLVTARSFGFLRELYPSTPIALYFHGGEIPAGGSIDAAEQRRAFELADRVFTNTAFSRDQAAARGCAAHKLSVCPVGFDLGDYAPPAHKRYRPDGKLRLVSIGRVSPEKGLLDAVQAVATLKREGAQVGYRIVGAGPQLAELRAQIATLRLEGVVELAGERGHDGVIEALAEADALLLPSRITPTWQETQACVVQEAQLMKLPVIATRTGGVPESTAPALRPLLVPPSDPFALAEQARRLLAMDEAELARLGESGREFVLDRYDIRSVTAQLLGEALAMRRVA